MAPEEQIDTVRRYMSCFDRGDWTGALEFTHPDVRVLIPSQLPYGGTWIGHDEVTRLMQVMDDTWSERHETPFPYQFACADNRVYREVTFHSILARTGKPVDMFFTELFEFRGAKIAEIRAYYADPAIVAAANES